MAKKMRETANKIGRQVEEKGVDAAHKIWLAGIGAYGWAFSEAREGATKLNAGTSEFFDDLVKRGEKIEDEVMGRLSANDRIVKAGERVAKIAGAAERLQKTQRERLEARMARMRTVLGFGKKGGKIAALHAKLDRLEKEVAKFRAETVAAPQAPDASIAERLARLTGEIEAIAAANTAKAPKPAAKKKAPVKKAATKKTATRKTAKKAPARKTVAKKAPAKKPAVKAAVKKPAATRPVTKTQVAKPKPAA